MATDAAEFKYNMNSFMLINLKTQMKWINVKKSTHYQT